ncbi:MAG: metallophosphoesterase [Deltaproteobacteria bacterium]|nr:metallophosphoesterase [Deltaproteobacteria bacterium]
MTSLTCCKGHSAPSLLALPMRPVLPALLALLALSACESTPNALVVDASPDVVDATTDASPDLDLDATPTPDGPDAFSLPAPPTTLKETVVGVLPASKQDAKTKIQFGLTQTGPGEAWAPRDDLLAVEKKQGTKSGSPLSLFFGVQLTDVHIVDEESPLRLVNYDHLVQGAYRLNEMFTTHVLDAMVHTINRLGDHYRPFDTVVITGDVIDNNQKNELDWFIDILDGKLVNPDSGEDEDPLPGPHNDANDPFQAAGLRDDVPWIVVVGNHDQLVQGTVSAIWPNSLPDSAILDLFPGISALITDDDGCLLTCFKDLLASPAEQLQMLEDDPRSTIALGTTAAAAVYPTVTPVLANEIGPGTVAADPARHLLTNNQWMAAFLDSPSKPKGHGMNAMNLANDNGSYAYDPVPGIPLRIIAIEMVSKSLADGSALATLRRHTYDNFVVPQLDKALADGVLVLLISHHQSWGFAPKGLFTPTPLQASKRDLGADELIATINSYPNVVLHLVGHGHKNVVKPHAASDDDPLKGYWEVETCSSNFWPQQGRIIEIVDNRDGTGTVYSTMLNFDIPAVDVPGWPHKNLAAQGRHYGLYDVQMGFEKNGSGTEADRNVLLHFAIPADIRAKIEALEASGSLDTRGVQSTGF